MGIIRAIKSLIFLAAGAVVVAAAGVYLYDNRAKIRQKIDTVAQGDGYHVTPADIEWAEKVMKGGYILHFRHAERDKWIDVAMYDALESDVHDNGKNKPRFAENDYFKDAVCLNTRGEIQARAMGEHLKNISFPIGYVVSSPSCRSRQTSDLAFGGSDRLDRKLVHKGPYNEKETERVENLRQLYLDLPIDESKNAIVSAHNSVVHAGMFENATNDLWLEEGGFYVISRKDGKLFMEHEFHYFNDFIRVFYPR